ncbi:MAG: cytochrome c [Verrucomicrobia bacterium]|nr:cytochrome c [Verrucomicrobiota bacterium]MDA1066446.1 cytochrome c [Verrucomicrobiota bacterium]
MTEDQSNFKSSEEVEDSNLVSLNDKNTFISPETIGYLAIVFSIILAVIYLARFSGGFDSNEYLESSSIASEMANLGGGSGTAGAGEVAAFDPVKEGKKIYQTNCMACHQVNGQGMVGAFPPLAESEWVAKNPQLLARIVLAGMQGPIMVKGTGYNSIMAPLGSVLNDEKIAHVLTYVRQEWGNTSGPVDAAVVAEAREQTGQRGMWTVEELKPWDTE